MNEALLQFKESLAKYSSSPLLHIAEAAEKLKVTEKYLTDLAVRGKIKAYKVGEHWFMEEKWLHDFRGALRQLLDAETGGGLQRPGWVRQLAPRKRIIPLGVIKPVFSFAFQTVAAVFVLAFVSISFAFLTLPLARVGLNRVTIASAFLTATYRVYGLPLDYARSISFAGPINDEGLTHVFYRLAGKNPPGQVAGVYEVNIR